MKGYIRQCTANIQKILEVGVCWCVYRESLLTSGERGIQKTLIPFVLTQSGWMLYYNNKRTFDITSELKQTECWMLDAE